jgi:hypothetical protein
VRAGGGVCWVGVVVGAPLDRRRGYPLLDDAKGLGE